MSGIILPPLPDPVDGPHTVRVFATSQMLAYAKQAVLADRAQRTDALTQIAVLAEYATTGPGSCKSDALTAKQATSLRKAISDIARAALPAGPEDMAVYDAIAAGYTQRAEPVVWMWQHDETGNIGFVDCWQVQNGWQESNPRLKLLHPLYASPQSVEQRTPLKQEMLRQMRDLVGTYEAKGAFVDGWTSAEQAHGIKEAT